MSSLLKYKGYEGTADIDHEDDVCFGKILFIDDLVTYKAATPKQLRAEFEAAVDDYIETCRELGREPKRPFNGQFNVRISPDQHKALARCAQVEKVSLNAVVARALDAYLASPKTRRAPRRDAAFASATSSAVLVGHTFLPAAFQTDLRTAPHDPVQSKLLETVSTFDRTSNMFFLPPDVSRRNDH